MFKIFSYFNVCSIYSYDPDRISDIGNKIFFSVQFL